MDYVRAGRSSRSSSRPPVRVVSAGSARRPAMVVWLLMARYYNHKNARTARGRRDARGSPRGIGEMAGHDGATDPIGTRHEGERVRFGGQRGHCGGIGDEHAGEAETSAAADVSPGPGALRIGSEPA